MPSIQRSLLFLLFRLIWPEELFGALEAHAIKAIVEPPSLEAEVALLELALVIAAPFLALRPVDLHSLQPTGQEIADHWITVLALAPYLISSVAATLAHKLNVVRRKLNDMRQYLLDVVADIVLMLAGIFKSKALLIKLRLQLLANRLHFSVFDLLSLVFLLLGRRLINHIIRNFFEGEFSSDRNI